MSLKVSLLLDGQLAPGEAHAALDEITADAVQRDRYTVYGLVGDALRGNSTPDDGFSLRIFERMREGHAQIDPAFNPLKDVDGTLT